MSKKQFKKIVYYWLPQILLMVLIFFLSSHHRVSITEESTIDFVIFKSLHMIEYGALFFLTTRAILHTSTQSKKHALLYAFIFCVLFAFSDEIHQTFVPTREGKLRDVLIDTVGISVVYWKYAKFL